MTSNNKAINLKNQSSTAQEQLNNFKDHLLDPQARELANQVQWQYLKGLSKDKTDLYPVAILGEGPPLLLLHGFDSSFLEFRRLVPLLINHHKLLIPDLFGFGFCPRPKDAIYGLEGLIFHLNKILDVLIQESSVGLIGASMGGAIAMELARSNPDKINRLLLLAPAGLTGSKLYIPRPLDRLGVCFLRQSFVRKGLCRQAFADPNHNVGAPEEQIASLHLNSPGWGRSLAAFARSGGIANCGNPLPKQPLHVLWGAKDKILNETQKKESITLLGDRIEELEECGHLPHLDLPKIVAEKWLKSCQINE